MCCRGEGLLDHSGTGIYAALTHAFARPLLLTPVLRSYLVQASHTLAPANCLQVARQPRPCRI